MTFDRDGNEFAPNTPLPQWLKHFAEQELKKGSSPHEGIQDLFRFREDKKAVEDRVKELRDRVGLDLVTEEFAKTSSNKKEATDSSDQVPGGLADGRPDSNFDPEQLAMGIKVEFEHTNDENLAKEIAKDHLVENAEYYTHLEEMEEKFAAARIQKLVSLANTLEDEGDVEGAKKIDAMLSNLSPKSVYDAKDKKCDKKCDCEKDSIFDEFPQIKKFIDNVCSSRQGHVGFHSILKMLRDERPEKIDVDNEELRDYIKDVIKKEKVELPESGDDVAGLNQITVFVVTEEDDGNKEVFDKPPTNI